MRKLIATALTLVLGTGIGLATAASAAPQAAPQTTFTCSHFQDPTVEFVWSHVELPRLLVVPAVGIPEQTASATVK